MITTNKCARVQSRGEGGHIVCSPDEDEPRFGAIMIYECATHWYTGEEHVKVPTVVHLVSISRLLRQALLGGGSNLSISVVQHFTTAYKFGPKYKCYTCITVTRPRHSVDGSASHYAPNETKKTREHIWVDRNRCWNERNIHRDALRCVRQTMGFTIQVYYKRIRFKRITKNITLACETGATLSSALAFALSRIYALASATT